LSTSAETIALRPATMQDVETVFAWRNSPFIVARGSFQKTVTWEEHLQWFRETVTGSRRKMLIVLVNGQPVGQVRFDRVDDDTMAISVYLIETHIGRGLGVDAIRMGCDILFGYLPAAKVVACVRVDNVAAQSGFRKAGFAASEIGQCPAGHITLVLRRER
jgi:UDP-2,4-diacetamido-2,4,6-trideoxy-beta-L-altropyranose hydrolase